MRFYDLIVDSNSYLKGNTEQIVSGEGQFSESDFDKQVNDIIKLKLDYHRPLLEKKWDQLGERPANRPPALDQFALVTSLPNSF